MDSKGDRQETDVWWGSYAGRTMLPGFLTSGIITLALVLLAWYCYSTGRMTASHARRAVEGPATLIWLMLLLHCGYRMIAWNYRLTTRHLFLERGFHTPAGGGIKLTRIAQVLVQRNVLERWVGVGRLRILLTDAPEPLILEGIRNPEHIAVEIRRRVEKAREEEKLCPSISHG
jgi:Bacterial PH domain